MVKLTKNGFVTFNNKVMGNSYILSVLGEPLEIDKDFTLRSFFKMLINYPQLVSLESTLLDYIYLYNTVYKHNEEAENNFIIKYNSYLVYEKEKMINIRHDLNVISKYKEKRHLKIDRFQIEDILDSKIILNKTVKSILIERTGQYGGKLLKEIDESFVVEHSSSLHEFIIWFAGSLFKGEKPEKRDKLVDNYNNKNNVNTYNLMVEIDTIIKS